jgi:hypothetical protein
LASNPHSAGTAIKEAASACFCLISWCFIFEMSRKKALAAIFLVDH